MSAHVVVPLRVYYTIFAALLVMTGITVAVSTVDLGPLNTIVALGIACIKALLVILYFMHVRWGARLTWLVVAGGVFWLVIMIVLTMADIATRDWLGRPTWPAAPVAPSAGRV
jgi:cytochrome c oxidase subunit 4